MAVIWIESEAPLALHVAAGGGCADTGLPQGPWHTPAEYTGQIAALPRDEYHAAPLTLAQVAATTMRAMPSATNDEASMLVGELRSLALRSDLSLRSLGLNS